MSEDEGEETRAPSELFNSKLEVTRTDTVNKLRQLATRQQTGLLEQIYVHDVYERIASDFPFNHYQLWPNVRKYLNGLPVGSIVADIGCGHGQYMNMNKNITVIGVDRSINLLQFAQSKNSGLVTRADCVSLPFLSSLFDSVICIGVLHHLVSNERQISLLTELSRILRNDGTAIIYVWAYEQSKRKIDGQDLLVPRQFSDSYLPSHHLNTPSKPANSSLLAKLQSLLGLRRPEPDAHRCQGCITAGRISHQFQVREFPASSLFISRRQTGDSSPPPCQHAGVGCHVVVGHENAQPAEERGRDERYYHMFKHEELVKLIKRNVSQLQIENTKLDSGHWCFKLVKQSL